tara:strand:- start:296 stop:481 length:186 start_codon:yes stop_codon:yes gene_type:complete
MKIKLKDKSSSLPNCWKKCGTNLEDWKKLQEGGEIEVSSVFVGIEHLVEVAASSKKQKGDK